MSEELQRRVSELEATVVNLGDIIERAQQAHEDDESFALLDEWRNWYSESWWSLVVADGGLSQRTKDYMDSNDSVGDCLRIALNQIRGDISLVARDRT